MTRGTLFLIEKSKRDIMKITETCEFNGDMYKEGNGETVINGLKKVENLEQFKKFVTKFDKDVFNYQAEEGGKYFKFYTHKQPQHWLFYAGERHAKNIHVYFRYESYFRSFFSDWTFWKNLTDIYVLFHTLHPKLYKDDKYKSIEGMPIMLLPNECVAIKFGYYKEHYKQ